jgi:hypothetical protein
MKKICTIILILTIIILELNAQDIDQNNHVSCDSILQSRIETSIMFSIGGRMAEWLPAPNNPNCETGLFLIEFTVNRQGKILTVEFLTKKSSTISDKLKNELLKVAKESRFSINTNSPKKQKGNITYRLKIKEKTPPNKV